jgi:hypothetical protein
MIMIPGTAAGGATEPSPAEEGTQIWKQLFGRSTCLHLSSFPLPPLSFMKLVNLFDGTIWWPMADCRWISNWKTITWFAQFQFLWICLNPVYLQLRSMQNWNWNISSIDWSNHSCIPSPTHFNYNQSTSYLCWTARWWVKGMGAANDKWSSPTSAPMHAEQWSALSHRSNRHNFSYTSPFYIQHTVCQFIFQQNILKVCQVQCAQAQAR